MSVALTIRNAFKGYSQKGENVKVLNNFNLTAKSGKIYSLIGPSGAGKTTLFSCILGITTLDSGEISIFGHNTKESLKLARHPKVVGYMPQETGLVEECTAIENLHFFANLYEMNSDEISERLEVLRNVLDIPSNSKIVANCSGGQKRRLSLAVAILCEPKLLFLDEPTVGIDPILRDKIGKFLRRMVVEKQMTIIVTTHYISEAEQSDCVGMMRKGKLLIEDSPKAINARFKLDGLDSVFELLCAHDRRRQSIVDVNNNNEIDSQKNLPEDFPKIHHKNFSGQRLKSLVRKELCVLLRQPLLFLFVTAVPMLGFYVCGQVFDYPKHIPIGVINSETNCQTLPQNFSSECNFESLSCQAIAALNPEVLKVIHYDSFDHAWKDAKAGKLNFILTFKKNFSQILNTRLEEYNELDENEDVYAADYYPDHTDLYLARFTYVSMLKSFEKFLNDSIVKNCIYSEKISNQIPMNFDNPIYDINNDSLAGEMIFSYFCGMMFNAAICCCCLSIIHDRKNGAWNRELLTGVSLFEIVTAHFIINIFIMAVDFILIALITQYTINVQNEGNLWLELLVSILVYISGIAFGILLSCLIESYTLTIFAAVGSMVVQYFLCGAMWPIEGMHPSLKPISYTLPSNLPAKALKNMFIKNYQLHPSIYLGLLVPTAWIVLCNIGLYILLKWKKFSSL